MFEFFKKKDSSLEYCKKEFGGDIYKVRVTIPSTTWIAADTFIDMQSELSLKHKGTKIDPAMYGWLLVSGLIKVRKRIRSGGDLFDVMKELLVDLKMFEQSSGGISLFPNTSPYESHNRELVVLFPDVNTYLIMERTGEAFEELNDKITKRVIYGYFLLFGLWDLKAHYMDCGDIIGSMKRLLEGIRESGEAN